MTGCIVFWQRMLTPHMTELAREVARLGVDVHFVAEEALSEERRAMGWVAGDLAAVALHVVTSPGEARALVDRLPAGAVHITSGVRANGLVADAQKRIRALGRRHYPIMEKVDLRGRAGRIKPLVYAARFQAISRSLEGMLCIGEGTDAWVAKRAPRSLNVFPFAYFLQGTRGDRRARAAGRFRFVYVGGLIERKRVDLLVEALAALADRPFALEVVGDGPTRAMLEDMTADRLSGRVTFRGTLAMGEAVERIKAADCLVLPSDHDGYGAVVSEALINGIPAVCSSECGAAGAVRASGAGGVFRAGDVGDLRRVLGGMLDRGPLCDTEREALSDWARCLTAEAGARYLLEILDRAEAGGPIVPPWERGSG
ncbi:MAG: glycosyltransferase family 4 protein [Maritimibacter sp.]|nr:glycosyltransferase family 4 protein [Maritimibacter sp.]